MASDKKHKQLKQSKSAQKFSHEHELGVTHQSSTIVSDSDQADTSQPQVHLSKGVGPRLRVPKWIFWGLILIVLVGGIVWASSYVHNRSVSTACTGPANAQLLQTAAAGIQSENPINLEDTVSTIKKKPGFDKDANCLYVVVNYYIKAGDAQNANTYFGKLQKVYSAKTGFSGELGVTDSMQTLQGEIKVIQSNSNDSLTAPNIP